MEYFHLAVVENKIVAVHPVIDVLQANFQILHDLISV